MAQIRMQSARVVTLPLLMAVVAVTGSGCDLSTAPPQQFGVDSAAGTALDAPVPWLSTLPYAAQSAAWSADGSKLLLASAVVSAGGQGTSLFSVAVPSAAVTKTLTVGGLTRSVACDDRSLECLVGLPDGRLVRIDAAGDTSTLRDGLASDFISSGNGRFVLHYENVANAATLVVVDMETGSRAAPPNYPLSFVCAISPDGLEIDLCGTSIVIKVPVSGAAEQHITPPNHVGWTPDGVRAVQWTAAGLTALVGWDSARVKQRFYEFQVSSGTETLLGEIPYTLYTQAAWTASAHRVITGHPSACIFVNQATQCLLVQFEFTLLDNGTATRVARAPAAILTSLTISPTGAYAAFGLNSLGNSAMYLKALP